MRIRDKRVNDRGSALVVVIISMLFLGIIASIVLGLAMRNFENTGVKTKASNNFYNAEEAVNELKDALWEKAKIATEQAYKEFLQTYTISYTGISEDDSERVFREIFSRKLKEALDEYFKIGDDGATPVGGFVDYKDLLYFQDSDIDKDGIVTGVTPVFKIDPETNLVHIEGISITYKDQNGVISTIDTDLVFDVKVPTIAVGASIGTNTNIADYALIADETITNNGAGAITVMGSVYGGGKKADADYTGSGLKFQNGTINLFSDRVVTRGTLETLGGATLNIKHSYSKRQAGLVHDVYYSDIWANNILMDGDTPSNISIQGLCRISDDLTIDSDKSKFELLNTDSKYYGYRTNNGKDHDAKTSSSVIVNGKGVTLDFSKASLLSLAGKSYISVPKTWGTSVDDGTAFQQGESISYRALQAAYMMPGECIMGVGHNPMSEAEYNDPNTYIDYNQSILHEGMDLSKYLIQNREESYSVEFVKYGTERLAYVYMNFRSPDKAAEYFRDYEQYYSDLVKARMDIFGASDGGTHEGRLLVNTSGATYDSIEKEWKLDETKVQTTGNIITYDGANYTLFSSNTSYHDLRNLEGQLLNIFKNLTTSLDESAQLSSGDLTANIVNFPHFKEVLDKDLNANSIQPIIDDATGAQVSFHIGTDVLDYPEAIYEAGRPAYIVCARSNVSISGLDGGTVTIDGVKSQSGVRSGIVIVDGDVTIRSNADFWGTIIATGTITIEGGGKVFAAASDVKKLMENNNMIIPFFSKDSGVDEDGTGVKTSDLVNIRYENWKKD